ncbi:hypothetical protein [Haloarcula litorea]|uniref:hypothetical protein n=1 Tax=Haloarcula litorea TaxID=3032579 RepID=UPI0023E774D9|nr:hypothetical protein [Halomicroarcula sp. GDY20]
MWRPLLVVAVVALAGCSGLLASGGASPPDGQAVTPAPVPERTERPVALPRVAGDVAVDRVLERHDAALAGRSFHRHTEFAGPESTRDVWVDRDADVVRVQRRFGPLADDAIVTNGTLYRSVSDDPRTDYATLEATGTPYVATRSGVATLDRLFGVVEGYDRVGTVRRDGRPLAVVASNDTEVPLSGADPDQTVAVESRFYVDRQGIVRYVDHWARRSDGSTVHVRMRITTGLDRVPIPWWAEGIGVYD